MDTPVAACLPMSSPDISITFPTVKLAPETAAGDRNRGAVTPPSTLAEVIVAIDANSTVGAERRKSLTAAIRTAARFLGRAPETTPCSPQRAASAAGTPDAGRHAEIRQDTCQHPLAGKG